SRIPLMGIRRKHHGSVLGATLLPLMFDRLKEPFLKRGLERVEMSWILEDNLPMRRVIEGVGGKVYKTYRLYEKSLS
ncbi:MAG: dATP pyrophosphohydrolase, partial [Rhodospirillaceae bacterium]|nr:dATP pyrophosphohydrolase [Rhodospirillaceae bacterium]